MSKPTPLSPRAVNAFAAAFAELRRCYGFSEWDENGIRSELRRGADILDPAKHIAAMAKAAARMQNLTPSSVNRDASWEPFGPCREHPHAKLREDGECAGCWADRQAVAEPLPLQPKSSRSDEDRARIRQIASGGSS